MNRRRLEAAEEETLAKLADLTVPGFQVPLDPDEAEWAGAFAEEALSEEDALESSVDLVELVEAS